MRGREQYALVTLLQAMLCTCALITVTGVEDWREAVPWWGRIITWLLAALAIAASALFWAGRAASLERLDIDVLPIIQRALLPLLALWWLLAVSLDLAWMANVQALHGGVASIVLAACGAAACAVATRVWLLALRARRRYARRYARAARTLDSVRSRATPAELRRIELWLEWQQGIRSPPVAIRGDSFPGLRDQPWHEPGELARLVDVAHSHQALRREILDLYESGQIAFQPLDPRHRDRGSVFHLHREGVRLDDACALCPETSELIERVTGGLSRNAFVAVVPPHRTTGVRQHRDNHFLTLCWSISTVDRCELRVGAERRSWQDTPVICIDGSYPHEICNHGNEPLILVLIDVPHPGLTALEQELFRTLAGAESHA